VGYEDETTRDEKTYCTTSQIRRILKKAGNKIYGFWRHSLVEDLQHNHCGKDSPPSGTSRMREIILCT